MNLAHSQGNLFGRIAELARIDPERVALVDERYRITFGQLPKLIDDYVRCIAELGVAPHDMVALSVSEQIPHLLICLALLKRGAHQIAIEANESATYHETICTRVGAGHLFRIAATFNPLNPRAADVEIIAPKIDGARRVAVSGPEPLILLMTSGTTKGVRIIPARADLLLQQAQRFSGLITGRVLLLSSIEQNFSKRFRISSLYFGATSVFYRGNTSSWPEVAAFVRAYDVNLLKISILNAVTLSRHSGDPLDTSTAIFLAGAHVSIALRRRLQVALSKSLYVHYGSTESGTVAIAGPEEHDASECVGKPFDGVTIEILDANGALAPAGHVGEIRMRGAGMIDRYFDDQEESQRRFRNGWYYPGDVGTLTNDGKLIVHGRKDDMMILNGINIYPSEIEKVFDSHPDVVSAAAIAIPSGVHGQIPAVAIELARGSKITETALAEFSKERLGIRRPRKVVLVKEMPRNTGGKVVKSELMELVKSDFDKP